MFKFIEKISRARRIRKLLLGHNTIDPSVMGRVLGMQVIKQDFNLAEDQDRALDEGVMWRRRRFRFRMIEAEGKEPRPEALCVNEITLESGAAAQVSPALAANFPHLVEFSEIENAYWATTFAAGAIRSTEDRKRETRLYMNLATLFNNTSGRDVRELVHALSSLGDPNRLGVDAVDLFDEVEHRIVNEKDGKFGIARYLPAFPASRLVQSSESILAAANAGYFLNFPEEYDDGVSALHQPVGGHVIDGALAVPLWMARPGIMNFDSGQTICQVLGPEDMVLEFDGLEPVALKLGDSSGEFHGRVWRHFDPPMPDPPHEGTALHYTGNLLTKIAPLSGESKALLGGGMITLTGEHAQAALAPDSANRIRLGLRPFAEGKPMWLISSGPMLVSDSRAVQPAKMLTPEFAGEFRAGGPPPTRFPFDTNKTRAPRTAFGILPSGGLKIVVVDGRRSGEHSCGLTLDGLAELMQALGCESAINLDGGGSSVMAIEGAAAGDRLRENIPYSVVNIPSDGNGTERIMPVFLIVRKSTGS